MRLLSLLTLCYFLFLSTSARCHIVSQIYSEWRIHDKEWELHVTFDAAYALPEFRNDKNVAQPPREWLVTQSKEGHARLRTCASDYLRESLHFSDGGNTIDYTISFPDYDHTPPDFPKLANGGAYFTVVIKGLLPENNRGKLLMEVASGERPNFIVAKSDEADGTIDYLVVKPDHSETLFSSGNSTEDSASQSAHGLLALLILGYAHVLPAGLDHILFILGLFLLSRDWKSLLAQSLAFTVAHSLTLGLIVSGFWEIAAWSGSRFVEPLIALSITAVAIENLFLKDTPIHRLVLVFGFGLVHGMGFAGSMGSVLSAQGDNWIAPLALANLGVELAQVTILAAAWALTTKWWQSTRYETFRKSTSIIIAGIGLYWAVSRLVS